MAVKVRSHYFQVIYYTPYQRSSSIEGRLPSEVVFCQRSSSVKDRFPSKVVFCQKLSSVKGRLPLKVVFLFWVFVLSVAKLSSAFCYLYLRLGLPQWPPLFFSSTWSTSMTSSAMNKSMILSKRLTSKRS